MEPVDPLVIELLESWQTIPAFVRSHDLDVLASNRLARTVSASFEVGVNLARFLFLNPMVRDASPHWAKLSGEVVALLREATKSGAEQLGLQSLVGELSAHSDQFSTVWAEDLRPAEYEMAVVMDHPQVGLLEVTYQQLALPGESGQMLVIGYTIPGSASEQRIFELAALLEDDDD